MQAEIPIKPSIVHLNVGGKCFSTLLSTLITIPYFKTLLTAWANPEEIIFVDLDSEIFTHILNKIRMPTYSYPTEQPTLNNIKFTLDYLGMSIESKKLTIKSKTFPNGSITFNTNNNHIIGVNITVSKPGWNFDITGEHIEICTGSSYQNCDTILNGVVGYGKEVIVYNLANSVLDLLQNSGEITFTTASHSTIFTSAVVINTTIVYYEY